MSSPLLRKLNPRRDNYFFTFQSFNDNQIYVQGLLGQFDTLELRISESGVECSGEVAQLKAFLDNKCKTATKSIKSFLREKNLDLNSSQHDAYHSLRNIRTSLDDLDLHLNKTLREFIEEGHEKVGVLRIEDVAPAMKIVSDYRYSVTLLL